jgi:hypothetical protein
MDEKTDKIEPVLPIEQTNADLLKAWLALPKPATPEEVEREERILRERFVRCSKEAPPEIR